MSLALVHAFAEELPPRLRDSVIGYARSVQDALPDIFRDAELRQDQGLADQLVLFAGIKKLYAICSGTFWILDNSLRSLREAQTYEVQVQVGSMRISRGSKEWTQLRDLLDNLEGILKEQRIQDMMFITSYAEVLHRLRDER